MQTEEVFKHVENHFYNELPFVIYNKPNDLIVKALFQKTDNIYTTEDFEGKGFVFAPFDDSNATVLMPLDESEFFTCKFEHSPVSHTSNSNSEIGDSDKDFHLKLIQNGIQSILDSQMQKVVLSRCESVPFSESQFISVFKKLLQNYASAFVYCWYHPKIGLWLGATPETLISVIGNRFKTMALAGTQQYEDTLDVHWNTKEIDEQQFVTDYIESCLKSSVSSLSISKSKTIRAGHLLHLQSIFSGIMNAELYEVLQELHPTPAVCGLPVKNAKSFILENESYEREYYTGFLGELNFKETISRNENKRNVENNAYNSVKTVSHLYVNLRCMQIKNSQALIYIGGGITKDSIPEKEWSETVSKAETMKRVLMS